MEPEFLSIRPVNKLIVVVLPDPLCPNKQKIFLLYKFKVNPLTALVFPKYFFKLLISTVN